MLASFERKRGVSRPEGTLAKNDYGVRFVVGGEEIWGRGEKKRGEGECERRVEARKKIIWSWGCRVCSRWPFTHYFVLCHTPIFAI